MQYGVERMFLLIISRIIFFFDRKIALFSWYGFLMVSFQLVRKQINIVKCTIKYE